MDSGEGGVGGEESGALVMSLSVFQAYFHSILVRVPWWPWAVICILTLTVFLLIRKTVSTYGAIALSITVFVGLLLLDTAVASRFFRTHPHATGTVFKIDWARLFHGSYRHRVELISNAVVFMPFGFFLSEALSSLKRLGVWRQIGYVTLASFLLSLCIECLQLVCRVGFFEVTDLVLNTVGGFVGAVLALSGRKVLVNRK